MNPRAGLLADTDRLVCERCSLRFRIRDGFPVLIVEEAELPQGCTNLSQLPCQDALPQPDVVIIPTR